MTDKLRDLIIAGSAVALKELGLPGFSMDAAAARAGVSRKTVYNYFPSRFELLDAVFEASVRDTIGRLGAIADDPELDFAAKLNGITEEGFRRAREGARFFRRGDGTAIHVRSAALYRELRRTLTGFIMKIVGEGAALGLFRAEVEPRKLTFVLINMVEGLLYLEDTEDEPYTRLEILQESLRALLVGVASPRGATLFGGSTLFSPPEAER